MIKPAIKVQGWLIPKFARHHLEYIPIDILDFTERYLSLNSEKDVFEIYFKNEKDLEKAKSLIQTYTQTQTWDMDTRLFECDPEDMYTIDEIEGE